MTRDGSMRVSDLTVNVGDEFVHTDLQHTHAEFGVYSFTVKAINSFGGSDVVVVAWYDGGREREQTYYLASVLLFLEQGTWVRISSRSSTTTFAEWVAHYE